MVVRPPSAGATELREALRDRGLRRLPGPIAPRVTGTNTVAGSPSRPPTRTVVTQFDANRTKAGTQVCKPLPWQ